jgi:hypothetical protein
MPLKLASEYVREGRAFNPGALKSTRDLDIPGHNGLVTVHTSLANDNCSNHSFKWPYLKSGIDVKCQAQQWLSYLVVTSAIYRHWEYMVLASSV